jgi:outer membrane protein
VQTNRDFRTRRESMYSQGLSFALARFEYGPQFRAAVNYLWPDQQIGQGSHGGGAQFGVSQLLPTNGTVELSAGANGLWPYGDGSGPNNFTTNVGISLSQPLLRGFGTRVYRESLTQAERELTYQIRDFEDFRQSFSIQVAQQFFELMRQQQTLANDEVNFNNAVFDRGRAEALWAVERLKQEEVFRSRRTEIQAKDQLISARADYAQALDRFKILLGIPTTTTIDLVATEPPFEPVRVEPESAVECALHNRLDLVTERQRVEDTERALRLAENGLLPDLSLTAGYALGGFGEDWCDAEPNFWTSNVGLSMSLPLQQQRERNSFRLAEIRLDQARRGLELLEDNLNLQIRNAIRNLHSIEQRIELQAQQVLAEQRAVEVMRIRFESDNVSNRDLLEARRAFVGTQNELIRLKVEHFISRLQLQKDLGVLFVDDQGMWQ